MKNRRRTTTKAKRPSAPKARGRRNPSNTSAGTKNTLLTRERDELLEQQQATAEVLRVISSSPGDLKPVFAVILENATRLCQANFGLLWLCEGNDYRAVAMHNAPPAFAEVRQREPLVSMSGTTVLAQVARTKRTIQVADIAKDPAYQKNPRNTQLFVKLAGARSVVTVPMLKDNELVGAFNIFRQEVRPFTEKQIALVEYFAAQAVIAIENTRLLNELRQRTDDLTELLEQQTATSEVLGVISRSPSELQSVFEAILANARRLCEAQFGILYLSDGDMLRFGADVGTPLKFAEFQQQRGMFRPRPGTRLEHVMLTREVTYTADLAATAVPDMAAVLGGARSTVWVPMLKDEEIIGVICIYRQEVRPFSDKQVALVQNFAAQAVIAIENTRLLNELRESLQQQTATADVLKVISSSPGELEPVFDAMLQNTVRICDAKFGNLWVREGDRFRIVAIHGASREYRDYLFSEPLVLPDPRSAMGRVAATGQVLQIDDISTAPTYGMRMRTATIEIAKARTLLAVPMLKDNEVVGIIGIYRQDVRAFTDKQIALVQNFAAQAVIAIENTRLLNELRELLEQQTATSEVLSVISSSPGELEPVFQSMLENATRICEAKFGNLLLHDGNVFHVRAMHNAPPAWSELRLRDPSIRPGPNHPLARMAATKHFQHTTDLKVDVAYLERDPALIPIVDLAGARTALVVPMLKDEVLVGAIVIYRQEVRPFTDKQIELVQNFAAQAVIAIENTRLLNELRQSLEQQTATSEVLGVISSSPGELQPVFQTMLENATRICEANFGFLQLCESETFRMAAMHNAPPAFAQAIAQREPSFRPSPLTPLGRMVATKQLVHVADYGQEPAYKRRDPAAVRTFELAGARSVIFVPMLKDDVLIGTITIYRQEVRPFTDKQIALVQNFAAQAVIAIENTRLLNELRESLEQQTATSEVLKVISSSPGDLEPVFQAMLENATRICEANFGVLNLHETGTFRVGATHNVPSAFAEFLHDHRYGYQPTPGGFLERVMRTKKVSHSADNAAETASRATTLGGARSAVCVPMLKDDVLVGTFTIYRQEVRPFTDKQIDLVKNFAAQAVIAIENTRLLNELRQIAGAADRDSRSVERHQFVARRVGAGVPGHAGKRGTRICEAQFGMLNLSMDNTLPATLHSVCRRNRSNSQGGCEIVPAPYPESGLAASPRTKTDRAHRRSSPTDRDGDTTVVEWPELGWRPHGSDCPDAQ